MAKIGDEIGHAVTTYGMFSRRIEDNPKLIFPRSSIVYSKIGREDAQVTAVLKAIGLPIQRASWRLNPNGADRNIVEHVASDLNLPILGDDDDLIKPRRLGHVSWKQHLQQCLMALVYGHMFFEQIYAVHDDGREHLHKLAPRHSTTLRKINVARDGGLESIEQAPAPGDLRGENIVIPVDRLVAYIHDPWDTSWEGTSILRSAYKHISLRDQLLRTEVSGIQRNSMGVPVYTGTAFAEDKERDLQSGLDIATGFTSGDSAGAAIPDGAKLELKGVGGQLTSPREAIIYHDSMIAKSVLAHFLNLEGKGGSYALAETQADLFIQSLQALGEWIADTATKHIVEDLVTIAYPEYEGSIPMITFDPIASSKEFTAAELTALVNAGVIFTDRDLEEEVRRRGSLPPKAAPPKPSNEDGGVK